MPLDAVTALSRFGLGARPGDLAAIAADPRAAVLAEIADPRVAELDAPGLLAAPAALAAFRDYRAARKQARADDAATKASGGTDEDDMAAMAADPAMMVEAPGKPGKPGQTRKQSRPEPGDADAANYGIRNELPIRLARYAEAPLGLAERLVMFWTNHFAIEADNGGALRALAGPFEREAIRPHILGRFEDLLLAATRHPAMLIYLNNATSVGPGSPTGKKRGKGLNENHARELMELHTLGVDGGYTQADVIALANILTGWSVGRNDKRADTYGRFNYLKPAHEPGAQTLLGQSFDQKGEAQGKAALALLARHPATARHLATKLVRHFVADTPPPDLVAMLEQSYLDTNGDLAAMTRTLITADAAWQAPPTKLRTPQEFVVAAMRATGVKPKPRDLIQALTALGQPLMNPPSPAGFADDTRTWLAPDAMTNRLDIAESLAVEAGEVDPRQLANAILGARLTQTTRQTIERAESPAQGVSLLLMSPEFQRR